MTHRFFSPFPKHLQIRELLLRRLERQFEVGDQFPTEQALADEFGVTRKTIRESLGWLEREGLIRRHRGQGTFVKSKPRPRADERLTGMTEHFAELKLDTRAELVEQGLVKAPYEIAAALKRPDDEPMFRVARLRHFEDEPLAF
ncbi:MAG: GntR family transcriptional regulator, partial [Rhodothermales bacterium]|nr:GntR family transcriptional regulator [Rhodothermales bacterium]